MPSILAVLVRFALSGTPTHVLRATFVIATYMAGERLATARDALEDGRLLDSHGHLAQFPARQLHRVPPSRRCVVVAS